MFDATKIKLPATKPDGSRTTKHPLVWALEQAHDLGIPASDVAESLQVTPQTLHIWRNRARADRHFLLPAEQVPALSVALGVPPFYFRPDLWPNIDWRF